MLVELIWTSKAEQTFDSNIEYLEKEWSDQVVNDFIDRVEEVVDIIQDTPKLYPLHKKSDTIRKCKVTEQITLYYRVENTSIKLLIFWNVYQNPKKLKKELL
jgi:plasmid stabilization system protein ParE